MKRNAFTFVLAILFSASLFAANTQRYTVVTKTPVGAVRAATMLRSIDTTPVAATDRRIKSYSIINGFSADLTPAEVSALKADPSVEYVSPSVERHAYEVGPAQSLDDSPNPNGQVVPYGIDLVHARDVWSVTRGDGINVAIIDTGIDYTHPELAPVYQGGHNEITGTDDPKDDNGHGTHVAGTIAAADNNVGVVGVAPHVKIWSVKVLDSSGSGSSSDIISALDWVEQKKQTLGGDWVINLSLGSPTPDVAERAAFQKAVQAGLLICAASGNDSTPTIPAPVGYPAAYTGVVAIGAIDSTRTIASFSNQGAAMGVVAPGVNVLSTVPLGSGEAVSVSIGTNMLTTTKSMLGSGKGTVTGHFVFCGYGSASEIPASVSGNIALIQRGNSIFFYDKARNAKQAGATAVVIFNNGGDFTGGFTLQSNDPAAAWTQSYNFPVTVIVDTADGATLRSNPNATITVSDGPSDYELLSGTSMATPHAVGVAALVWSVAPNLASTDIINALEKNADDLGATGFDTVYGNGLIDALNAAKAVAPEKFGSPATPPPSPLPRRHSVYPHH